MCVAKTVDWGGDGVVEVVKRTSRAHGFQVEQPRKPRELRGGLPPQSAQEVPFIDARETSRDMPAAALQIERHRDGSRRPDPARKSVAALAEPFQKHVPAERHTAQYQGSYRVLLHDPSHGKFEIGRFPRVVEPRRQIGLVTATAENEHIRSPTVIASHLKNPAYGVRPDGAFETREEKQTWSPRSGVEAQKLYEVIIRRLPPFDSRR